MSFNSLPVLNKISVYLIHHNSVSTVLQWCHTLSAWVLSRYPGFLSPSTDVHISLIGSSKLSVGVSVDSWPSVLAHDEVATYPGSAQPSPSDRHHHSQFCLSSTRNRVLRARCSERIGALFPSHTNREHWFWRVEGR